MNDTEQRLEVFQQLVASLNCLGFNPVVRASLEEAKKERDALAIQVAKDKLNRCKRRA